MSEPRKLNFSNWAETYRLHLVTGTIYDIDRDESTATFHSKGTEYEKVEIVYNCPDLENAGVSAFSEDDEVIALVRVFSDEITRSPDIKIIGFPDGSRLCSMLVDGKILLAGGDSIYSYNWVTDKLTLSYEGDLPNGDMHGEFDTRCQIEDRFAIYSELDESGKEETRSWVTDVLVPKAASFFGLLPSLRMSVFFGTVTSFIYGRIGKTIGIIGNIDSGQVLPEYSVSNDGELDIAIARSSSNWNLYKAVETLTIVPKNRHISNTFQWVPSFYYAEPRNGTEVTGWHYGKKDGWKVNGWLPVDNGKVRFMGLLETRDEKLLLYRYGYCEHLRELDGVRHDLLTFFLSDYPSGITPNQSWFSWLRVIRPQYDIMRGGHSMYGFSRTFSIDLPFGFSTEIEKVHTWNFSAWVDDEAIFPQPPDAVGVVISTPGETVVKFYRYKGYLSELYTSYTYHSHKVSTNGRILTIFEHGGTTTDHIDRVKVIDLYGVRKDKYVGGRYQDYLRGGFTVIRESNRVSIASSTRACIIPEVEDTPPMEEPDYILEDSRILDLATINEFDDDHRASFGSLKWTRNGTGSLYLYKLHCEDGINAQISSSVDECFDSEIILEDPDEGINTERMVTYWKNPDLSYDKGVVRGNFSGPPGGVRFQGIGSGISITRPPTFPILIWENGDVGFQDVTGEVIIGDCIIEEDDGTYHVDDSCKECNESKYKVTAESTCGQKASNWRNYDPIPPITGIMDSNPDPRDGGVRPGSVFQPNGGKPPYEWDFGGGSVDSDGTVTSINACGTVPLSVKDACDNSFSTTVRMVGGKWEDGVWVCNLKIGGSGDVAVGEVYTASGGIGPYTYKFSGGFIDDGGKITDVSECRNVDGGGTAKVTAVDSTTGESVSMDVRLPGGRWIFKGDEGCCPGCSSGNWNWTKIVGPSKIVYQYQYNTARWPAGIGQIVCENACTVSQLPNGQSVCNSCGTWSCVSNTQVGVHQGYDSIWQEYHKYVYEWGC